MTKNICIAMAMVLLTAAFPIRVLARDETSSPATTVTPSWPATPSWPSRPSRQTVDKTLDELLDRLAKAGDELESRHIAEAVLQRWARANSDTIDLLAVRAQAADAAGAAPLARQLLDYVVALAPNWADGYVRRARLRASTGDDAGALRDLETALLKEPRRFDALAMQGALAERSGDKKLALAATRKALALQPMNEDLRKSEDRLKTDVEGRDI